MARVLMRPLTDSDSAHGECSSAIELDGWRPLAIADERQPSAFAEAKLLLRRLAAFVQDMARAHGRMFEEVEAEFFEKVRPTSLIKRFGTPQEVASLVAHVASPLASATTGAALRVDGGVIKSAF